MHVQAVQKLRIAGQDYYGHAKSCFAANFHLIQGKSWTKMTCNPDFGGAKAAFKAPRSYGKPVLAAVSGGV
jgi:hypothetical protein